jgi:hypothetical protein
MPLISPKEYGRSYRCDSESVPSQLGLGCGRMAGSQTSNNTSLWAPEDDSASSGLEDTATLLLGLAAIDRVG